MSELRYDHGPQHKQDTGTPGINLENFSDEQLGALQAMLDAARGGRNEPSGPDTAVSTNNESGPSINDTVDDPDATPTVVNGPTPDQQTDSTDTAAAQAPEAGRVSRRTLLWGVLGVGGATALGGGLFFANRPQQAPTGPAPTTPQPTPTVSEIPQPTPSETTTGPEAGSQMEMAQELLGSKNAEFNAMPLSLRQRAVDGRYVDIVSGFTDETLYLPYIAGRKPYTEEVGKFAAAEGKDLYDFNPVDIASLVGLGEASDNKQASAQDILNQLTFAKAVAWGQVETPLTRQLDPNTAANMVSGYYFDPKSSDAQDMIAELQRSKTMKVFGPESYTKPGHVTSSGVLYTNTFDELGRLDYKVINYNLGNGNLYKIVTPVTTEFTGPDPRGVKGSIATLSITKWLVLKEGTGTEDIYGRLKHFS